MAHTKESIVLAAVAILNRDGSEGLSMRTLAKELGVKAAALYWHFDGKRELFGAIAEHLCERRYVSPDADDVTEYLMESYRAYRAMLLTVRDSPVVFENSVPVTPRRVEIIRDISSRLLMAGVEPENLMTISNMLNNYVLSFVADEARFKRISPEDMKRLSEALDPADALIFISSRDFDEQFELGLRVIMLGVEGHRNSG